MSVIERAKANGPITLVAGVAIGTAFLGRDWGLEPALLFGTLNGELTAIGIRLTQLYFTRKRNQEVGKKELAQKTELDYFRRDTVFSNTYEPWETLHLMLSSARSGIEKEIEHNEKQIEQQTADVKESIVTKKQLHKREEENWMSYMNRSEKNELETRLTPYRKAIEKAHQKGDYLKPYIRECEDVMEAIKEAYRPVVQARLVLAQVAAREGDYFNKKAEELSEVVRLADDTSWKNSFPNAREFDDIVRYIEHV